MFNLKEKPSRIILAEGKKLSDYEEGFYNFKKDGLPNGILNKKYPGTGATYCEFMADGPSIIVFPFRSLAQEKAEVYEKKGRSTFYIGSDSRRKKLTKTEIKDWYKKHKNKSPKFSVVADSIGSLIDALKEKDFDPYKEFKLVLDEVELLQMQSGFRGRLPLCFDYFKKFEKKCLVSATLLDFSDNELKKLPIIDLEIVSNFSNEEGYHPPIPKKNLQIRRFEKEEPHIGIAHQVAEFYKKNVGAIGKVKFFIGLNSIDGIKEMIYVFEKTGISSVSVLVSEDSKDRFLPQYNSEKIGKGILPSDVNITTCINWSGVDIKEEFHSVAISLNSKIHHSFSVENLIQFFGRSRIDSGQNTFTLALGPNPEIEFKEREVSIGERRKQLEDLIGYVKSNISDNMDRIEILNALAKTESSLLYENKSGEPAINWLLEDLERYQVKIVEDYSEKAKGLLNRLGERFEILEFPFDAEFEFKPEEKSDLEIIQENYDTFLKNLNDSYPENLLVQRFKDEKQLKKVRVAAYWFLLGRLLGFESEYSKKLANHFSSQSKAYHNSSILIAALRVYSRHPGAFKELTQLIDQAKTTHQNVKSSKILQGIKENENLRGHFKDFIYSKDASQDISVLLKDFFGLRKKEGSNPSFTLKEVDLTKPELIFEKLKGGVLQITEVNKTPQTKGVEFIQNGLANLIDENFK